MPNRRALLGGVLALPALSRARAADWPERPIRLVVPYPAGGGVDMTARLMTAALSAKLGQTIVVDNRAGAGSNIGAEYVARSAPDGYTAILSTNSTFV
ncbi:MAG: LacI family transcriptional regulator, partial [Rubritepida sp.]|nr:LacI family transcriptional regulator [Rubritepida sp.]